MAVGFSVQANGVPSLQKEATLCDLTALFDLGCSEYLFEKQVF